MSSINPDALRAIRELHGLSVRQVARACDISHAYLSRIETGQRDPEPRVVRRLADYLRVPIAAITNPCQKEVA